MKCKRECFNCPFDDCQIETVRDRTEYHKAYYQQNRERILAYHQNPTVKKNARKNTKRYREANRERILAYHREYYKRKKLEIIRKSKSAQGVKNERIVQ